MGPLCGWAVQQASPLLLTPKPGASSLKDSSQSASLSGHKLLPPFSLLCTPLAFPTRPFLMGLGLGEVRSGFGVAFVPTSFVFRQHLGVWIQFSFPTADGWG